MLCVSEVEHMERPSVFTCSAHAVKTKCEITNLNTNIKLLLMQCESTKLVGAMGK